MYVWDPTLVFFRSCLSYFLTVVVLNPGVFLCCDRVLHDFYNPAAARVENSGFSVRFGLRNYFVVLHKLKRSVVNVVFRVSVRGPRLQGTSAQSGGPGGPAVPGQEALRAALLLVWDGGLSPASKRSKL